MYNWQTVWSVWRARITPYVPDWLPNTLTWTRCVRCWTTARLQSVPNSSPACGTTPTPASTSTTLLCQTSASWEYRCARQTILKYTENSHLSPVQLLSLTFTFMHLADDFIQSDIQAIHYFISICVPWESNPQPFVLLAQCSTTEPQEHLLKR